MELLYSFHNVLDHSSASRIFTSNSLFLARVMNSIILYKLMKELFLSLFSVRMNPLKSKKKVNNTFDERNNTIVKKNALTD